MKTQTKMAVVVSAAALLVVGASITAMAAAGWRQEGDDWYYYDSSDNYVTDVWKTSGSNRYYLGGDGTMQRNMLIEDGTNHYFVGEDGAMVKNEWRQVENTETDVDATYRWYYFGPTGRAYKDTNKKTINGKNYGFDSEGRMLFGFADDNKTMLTDDDAPLNCTYYYGNNDDGEMKTGWYKHTDGIAEWAIQDSDNRDYAWFFFNPSNGKKEKDKTKTINGKKYSFEQNGVMEYKWVSVTTKGTSTTKFYSEEDDGHLVKKGWVYAVPTSAMNENGKDDKDADQKRWFYANSDGNIVTNTVKKINSKYYFFNKDGVMLKGLHAFDVSHVADLLSTGAYTDKHKIDIDLEAVDGSDLRKVGYSDNGFTPANEGGVFYFSNDEDNDGAMKTGTVKVPFADGDYTMKFQKTGAGYNWVEKDKLYVNGILVEAGDMKYQIANGYPTANDANNNTNLSLYVVSASGSIVKKGKVVHDADSNYYVVKGDGSNTKIGYVVASDDASRIANAWLGNKKFKDANGDERSVVEGTDIVVFDMSDGIDVVKSQGNISTVNG